MFETAGQRNSKGNKGKLRKLRRRRHTKTYVELRGKIPISTQEANEITRLGDFEADIVAGKKGKDCLLTLTDRKSHYLIFRRDKI